MELTEFLFIAPPWPLIFIRLSSIWRIRESKRDREGERERRREREREKDNFCS